MASTLPSGRVLLALTWLAASPGALSWVLFSYTPRTAESCRGQYPPCSRDISFSFKTEPYHLLSVCWSSHSLGTWFLAYCFLHPPVLFSRTHVDGPYYPLVSRYLDSLTSSDLSKSPIQPPLPVVTPGTLTLSGKEIQASLLPPTRSSTPASLIRSSHHLTE